MFAAVPQRRMGFIPGPALQPPAGFRWWWIVATLAGGFLLYKLLGRTGKKRRASAKRKALSEAGKRFQRERSGIEQRYA